VVAPLRLWTLYGGALYKVQVEGTGCKLCPVPRRVVLFERLPNKSVRCTRRAACPGETVTDTGDAGVPLFSDPYNDRNEMRLGRLLDAFCSCAKAGGPKTSALVMPGATRNER
jgi:hypothetical protein